METPRRSLSPGTQASGALAVLTPRVGVFIEGSVSATVILSYYSPIV